MKITFFLLGILSLPLLGLAQIDPATTLWYTGPAEKWADALPIGNGRLAAMYFGNVQEDRLQFNEESYWTGGPYSTVVKGGYQKLPEIQKLLFEGRGIEARHLFGRYLLGYPVEQQKYQSMGNVVLDFTDKSAVTDYRRELDLDTGITRITYARSGTYVIEMPGDGNRTRTPSAGRGIFDASIGLAAAPGAALTVRQRHPFEMMMRTAGSGAAVGGTLDVELDPFSLKLIQIDTKPPAEPSISGVPYEIIPGPGDGSFNVKLLGRPGQKAEVELRGFGDRPVRTSAGISIPAGGAPWPITFPGAPAIGPSFARLTYFRDDSAAAADAQRLTELAKFTLDDDALEIREMVRLKREPSNLAEIEACRAYMWDKVVAVEGTHRNAFDGNPETRWSDGFPRRSPFTGSPAAYRSETSLWRIDLGRVTDLARLELRVARRTDAAFLEAIETSADLTAWTRAGGLSLAAADGIPASGELRQRRKTIKVFDVDAGDKVPVAISVPLADGPCRYVRIRGRNFGVTEILGYDGAGKLVDRSGWRATNFFGETSALRRVLTAVHVPAEDASGREYAVAVTAGPAQFDPVDGVYVVALVDGRPVVPHQRAPSYPYHNYEWNSGAPKLAGMTFRLPIDRAWKGKTVDFRIMMYGDGADGAEAVLRLVTPKPMFSEVMLRVGPADRPVDE